jgi:ABC-type multidrug transport system ATPase subunit
MTEVAIHIENLIRDLGPVRALDNLSLEVPAGIIFGFLGPNGAGKTTIRLLLGLLEPTSGRVEVLGFDIRRRRSPHPHRRIARTLRFVQTDERGGQPGVLTNKDSCSAKPPHNPELN